MAEIKNKKTASTKTAAVKKEQAKKPLKQAESMNGGSFAIIETGGKQYKASVGDIIKIEKVNGLKEGDAVIFDKVLMVDNGVDATDVGTPYLNGVKVSGTVVEVGRNKKVIVLKYKQKSRYLKKNGHRQPFFKVRVEKIS